MSNERKSRTRRLIANVNGVELDAPNLPSGDRPTRAPRGVSGPPPRTAPNPLVATLANLGSRMHALRARTLAPYAPDATVTTPLGRRMVTPLA